ncbi:L-methionine gamma-lyase [Reticulibacter mediterranei]|uniref:L-methionine gamma-lyase n=1 Tax=Reticulibacter mediterranei TaxID=2778369 RepID=A0A8J3IM41_9CHLR|nr:aminotransferase class I/II-fold pyridoxal phosphate-dependent enzyme [Reticulibacter mediterranei]GHO94114.1 L-methionine gamma-lyase [Reticulibacter mediterranei]
MSEQKRDYGLQTRLIHDAHNANDTTAVSPPIFQTSTFLLRTPEEGAELAAEVAPGAYYTRYGSPNNKQVEILLAELEESEAALALGSGMAAITTAILANVQKGDHVVAQQTHYTATLSLLAETLPRYGVEVTQVDQRDTESFAHAIRPNTRIVYTETPTNPTMDLTDLRATAEIAHAAGALAITDNTFASAYNQHPLEFGYDLVTHSATKYLNGHADVTAGAIMGSRALIDTVWEYSRVHGPVLHPFESWLLRRGLQTYGLRMAVHNANALAVAQFLEQHSQVERVYYPGLPSHPQHALAKQQMPGGFGGMLSFEVKGGYQRAYEVVRHTEVCLLAVSLGGVETLITHPASMIHAHQSDEQRETAGISPGLLRLSVGVENVEDIIADLDSALNK